MFEAIRFTLMEWIVTRYDLADSIPINKLLAPNADSKYLANRSACRGLRIKSGDNTTTIYEIQNEDLSIEVVKLDERTCTCSQWQEFGIPCKHAVKALIKSDLDPHLYCEEFLFADSYLESYENHIKPIPHYSNWIPASQMGTILPPIKKKNAGRPKSTKRKESMTAVCVSVSILI